MSYVKTILQECRKSGIKLLLRSSSKLTIDAEREPARELVDRIARNKAEILRLLDAVARDQGLDFDNPNAVWQATLDNIEADPTKAEKFTPSLFAELRQAKAEFAPAGAEAETDHDEIEAEPVGQVDELEAIALDELPLPCPDCKTFEIWEAADGQRYCLRCKPPTASRAFMAKRAEWERKNAAKMQREADKRGKGGANNG